MLLTFDLTQANPSKLGLKPNKYGPSNPITPPSKKTNLFPEGPTEFSSTCVLIGVAQTISPRRVPQVSAPFQTPSKRTA